MNASPSRNLWATGPLEKAQLLKKIWQRFWKLKTINHQRSDREGKWEACCAIILVNDNRDAELQSHKTFRGVMKAWVVTEHNSWIGIWRDSQNIFTFTSSSDAFQDMNAGNICVSGRWFKLCTVHNSTILAKLGCQFWSTFLHCCFFYNECQHDYITSWRNYNKLKFLLIHYYFFVFYFSLQ